MNLLQSLLHIYNLVKDKKERVLAEKHRIPTQNLVVVKKIHKNESVQVQWMKFLC